MRRMNELEKVTAISIAAVLSLMLLTSTTLPAMVAAQNEDETAARVAKNKQYLAEAQALVDQKESIRSDMAEYEKQKEGASSDERKRLDAKIDESKAKINDIETQLNELENLNKALFDLEPELEAKLYAVADNLEKKYLDETSTNYVGENPVDFVFPDVLTRTIEVYIDPWKVAADGSNLPQEKNIGGIPVKTIHSKTEPLTCTPASRTGVCRPLLGGVSISEQSLVPNSLNTLSYKATYQGHVGFVLAGHTATGLFKTIVQPHIDATKAVAQTLRYCFNQSSYTCDFAWAQADSGITVNNQIYGPSSTLTYTVTQTTSDSVQSLGTWVYESSAASGVRVGNIDGNLPGKTYNSVNITPNGGDSGSPIFVVSGSNANLYGMIFLGAGVHSLYYPQDYIQSQIGAVPSTS